MIFTLFIVFLLMQSDLSGGEIGFYVCLMAYIEFMFLIN